MHDSCIHYLRHALEMHVNIKTNLCVFSNLFYDIPESRYDNEFFEVASLGCGH